MHARAFAVHVFTACGAALALMALLAATRGEWAQMFVWLGAALIVDAVDGPLARRFKVAEVAPRWSGEVLDLVVDFTTYVFIPAYAIVAGGLMPEVLAIPCGIAIAVTGALYVADGNMKAADNHFCGFPAVWNLIAFYLLLLRPQPWQSAMVVALFAVLTFVPLHFVHPIRVRRLRALTVALLVLWSLLALAAIAQGLDPGFWIKAALFLIAGYFLLVGLLPRRAEDT